MISHRVIATREGLLGGKTATGYKIEGVVPFVALPAFAALRLWVNVINPLNNKSIDALVLDVGPHYEHNYDYVFGNARPLAESGGKDDYGRVVTNGAGIDLGELVWNYLEMKDNTEVIWQFI